MNLLKNPRESGSPPAEVALRIRRAQGLLRFEVLANALVPFYSTKRSGAGLGLALARDIAEAHGGRITPSNRDRDGDGLAAPPPPPAAGPAAPPP